MTLGPLQIAARDGQHETVKLMLRGGERLKTRNTREELKAPIMLAASNGHALTLRAMMEAEHAGMVSGCWGPHNVTPLLLAARRGFLDAVKELIKDVEEFQRPREEILDSQTDYGMTALMGAAQFGSLEVVRALVDAGANWKDIADIDGNNALAFAIKNNHRDIVQWLVDIGANMETANGFGQMPRDLAKCSQADDILAILQKGRLPDRTALQTSQLAEPLLPGKVRARSEGSSYSKMPWHMRIAESNDTRADSVATKAETLCDPVQVTIATENNAIVDQTVGKDVGSSGPYKTILYADTILGDK